MPHEAQRGDEARAAEAEGGVSITTFPRWVAGGPADTSGLSPALLREVTRNLYVGSALAAAHVPGGAARFRPITRRGGALPWPEVQR